LADEHFIAGAPFSHLTAAAGAFSELFLFVVPVKPTKAGGHRP
jgi:hypothetical protein